MKYLFALLMTLSMLSMINAQDLTQHETVLTEVDPIIPVSKTENRFVYDYYLTAGAQLPLESIGVNNMFFGRGHSVQTGFKAMKGVLGFGINAGVSRNNLNNPEATFDQSFEKGLSLERNAKKMTSNYISAGPQVRVWNRKMKWDIGTQFGVATSDVPELDWRFSDHNFNNEMVILSSTQEHDRLTNYINTLQLQVSYEVNPFLAVLFDGQYVTNMFFGGKNTTYEYRSLEDKDSDGMISQNELYESFVSSQTISQQLDRLSLGLGILVKLN